MAAAATCVSVQVVAAPQPPPLQPPKLAPAPGVAVSVTVEPAAYGSLQSAPQAMPAGLEVTVPLPAPPRLTVSVVTIGAKVAVTVRA